MAPNLATLNETVRGASRTCAWTADGAIVDVPGLAVGDGSRASSLPRGTMAVGVAWPIAHVADRVKVVFAGASLETVAPELQVFDGARWIKYADGLTAKLDDASVEISFDPVATRMLRLLLPASSGVSRIEVHRYLAEAAKPTWPARVVSGELARQMLAREEEPSFETLSLHCLSMPTWAMTGLKDLGDEQAVYWDGQIHCHGRRILLAIGEPAVHLAEVRDTLRRRLVDGWMPGVIVEGQVGDIAVTQTSFAVFCDDAGSAQPAMFVRIELANFGAAAFAGPVRLEVRDAPADPFEGTLGVDIFNPPQDKDASVWELKDGALHRIGKVFLAPTADCRAGNTPGQLVFDIKLAPGGKTAVGFVVPSPRWAVNTADVMRMRAFDYDKMFARFKAYWSTLLAPAMKLDLPEPRLCNMYRTVLAQLFINAYGDKMPYGAAPSNYDGSVYGVEEAYAIFALGMSGFSADAQRYMDATHLQKHLLAKAENFTEGKDRNQQNHNGIRPSFAVELFRLTRDRAWIQKHYDVIIECAEWTIANRKKTMQLVNGEKPAHYGLLPKWAYGGDLHDLCYPLFPNFCCWRGLKDTAWLANELGDAAGAARFKAEADDYRTTLLALVDRLYRKDAPIPFLPLRTDAKEPDSADFYQLFAGLLVDLLPFDFSDPRANYLGDFLERDNRTFCLLPRFRRDGSGGIDAIYGMGHILSRLHQNRTREFLLGFYAFQAFNMEHTCFTSREQNRIYSSDLHLRHAVPVMDWSDPLPCSSAVALLMLRHMLVTEESRGGAEYTGKLLLLYGAPRRWFAGGGRIAVEDAPTHAGRVSFSVGIDADLSHIGAVISLPPQSKCPAIKIRLRHPAGKPMKSVSVNGKNITSFDARDELVEVASPTGKVHIDVQY